jgi:hypothetical protein
MLPAQPGTSTACGTHAGDHLHLLADGIIHRPARSLKILCGQAGNERPIFGNYNQSTPVRVEEVMTTNAAARGKWN